MNTAVSNILIVDLIYIIKRHHFITLVVSLSIGCRLHDSVYVLVQGLGSAPDVPHAANVSFVAGGSGVGTSKEPPVNVKVINPDSNSDALTSLTQVCFYRNKDKFIS